MSREGKAEVQVSHPGQAFPFGPATAPSHPHVNQWCRFTVPERLPLKPFRQDRLTRLPLPPSIMATSKVVNNTGAGAMQAYNASDKQSSSSGIDPFQKIYLLEKNLAFVQESHAEMLKGLHEEIADLKQKNRELLFQLVTGSPPLPNEKELKTTKADTSEDQKEKIEKLEKEIKKLRDALKDAIKTNSSLTVQLKQLKSEQQYSKPTSHNKRYSKTPPDSAIDDGRQLSSPSGPSPQMEEYCDTLRQIQRATNYRNGRRDDRRYPRDDNYKNDWSDLYTRNGHGYHHHNNRQHHRHPAQKSPLQQHQQQQQQPRLPRLPLRNQQNYQQRENDYRVRSSNTLPALKQPLVPVMDHRLDKPRKSRGPRAPKLADQVTNA